MLTTPALTGERVKEMNATEDGAEKDWQPIETLPKHPSDGTVVQMRQGNLAPSHACWKDGRWHWVEFQFPAQPTHWKPQPDLPKGQV